MLTPEHKALLSDSELAAIAHREAKYGREGYSEAELLEYVRDIPALLGHIAMLNSHIETLGAENKAFIDGFGEKMTVDDAQACGAAIASYAHQLGVKTLQMGFNKCLGAEGKSFRIDIIVKEDTP